LHVNDNGGGAPVVLVHGLGTLGAEIAAPLTDLESHFRVIAPDRPGYGRSTLSLGDDPSWSSRMLGLRCTQPPIIVAHSIGAITALKYALKHPSTIAGLVLVAPFCKPTQAAAMPLLRLAVAPIIGGAIRRYILPRLASTLAPARIAAVFAPEPVSASFGSIPLATVVRPNTPLAMARDLRRFNTDAAWIGACASGLDVPAIILAGTADPIIDSADHATWLAQRAPDAAVVKVKGGGHMLHHTHPAMVINAVRTLARRAARQSRPGRPRLPADRNYLKRLIGA
jgi:pimeloyl-ACP methyl ester carboxylesterase